jgi:hypothetical protein
VRTTLIAGLAMCGLSSCTMLTDASGVQERAEPLLCGNDVNAQRKDLTVRLTKMAPHLRHMTVGDLVRISTDNGTMRRSQVGRFMWLPLGAADTTTRLPCSVLAGNHALDLWADLTGDFQFTQCDDGATPTDPAMCGDKDHQWRLPLQAGGTLEYEHDTEFRRLDVDAPTARGSRPLTLFFANFEDFVGMRMTARVRVVDETRDARDETIFELTVPQIEDVNDPSSETAAFLFSADGIVVPNLVKPGERFDVALWIDTNENGHYDTPDDGRTDRDYATVQEINEEGAGARLEFDGSALPETADARFEF